MSEKDYGRTRSGKPLTADLVAKIADDAEAGFDVEEILRRRGGRPAMGAGAAAVESVRLDLELRSRLRAAKDGRTSSEVIRRRCGGTSERADGPDLGNGFGNERARTGGT